MAEAVAYFWSATMALHAAWRSAVECFVGTIVFPESSAWQQAAFR
jgi:hypothetical protein